MESRFPNDEMVMAATVLDPSSWPTDDNLKKVLYGDCEVAALAKTAGMPVCAQKIFLFIIRILILAPVTLTDV
jgi:hypothetical protein